MDLVTKIKAEQDEEERKMRESGLSEHIKELIRGDYIVEYIFLLCTTIIEDCYTSYYKSQ